MASVSNLGPLFEDAGALAFRPAHCHPQAIVVAALEDAESLAEARGIVLTSEVAKDLPCIDVDLDCFVQVLTHLLANATRCTRRGGNVCVVVRSSTEEVTFSIRDAGFGLGLSLCTFVVESSGGRIWLTGEADAGTTVTFGLPVATDLP